MRRKQPIAYRGGGDDACETLDLHITALRKLASE